MAKRGPYKEYLNEVNASLNIPNSTKYFKRCISTNNVSRFDSQKDEFMRDSDGELSDTTAFIEEGNNDMDIITTDSSEKLFDDAFEITIDGNTSDEDQIVEVSNWDQRLDYEEHFADDDDCFLNIEDFDNDQTNAEQTPGDSLLYDGAPLTLGTSLLLIITFTLTHNLTGQALTDLLSLIACHCATPNLCALTVRQLKKHFQHLKAPLVCHYYCSFCYGLRQKDILNCGECGRHMTKEQASKAFFIESPVAEQLKTLFARSNFYRLLSYPESRKKKSECNIEDILDGTEYKNLKKTGKFLSFQNHFSFMLNTDGVALFRSSAFSIWPVFLQINELPPHLRTNSNNVILAGLWFGEKKPYMDTFLQPFKSALDHLQSQGLKVSINGQEEDEITVKFMLLGSSFDLPCKCMVQNFQQFNGFYGCSVCEKPGHTCATSARGHTHVYTMTEEEYQLPSGHPAFRTPESTSRYAREAIRQKLKQVKGVKGYSVLHDLKGFNIIKGVAVDYMHCVLLGVVKMLLSLWFDKSHKGQPFYCDLDQAEERLLSIKPTLSISRTPRSIGQHRKYWKASELRAWLLYYSVPVMSGILPRRYIKHLLCLVRGVYLLLTDSISREDLKEAAQLLATFVFYMDILYAERYCTANVHYLLHLTESVIWLGPLWATSCFAFENLNGVTKKLFHGTQYVAEQILSAVATIQGIPTLSNSIPIGCPADALFKKMTHQSQSGECRFEFADGYVAIGLLKTREFGNNPHEDNAMMVALQGQLGKCRTFPRCGVNGKVIHSISYKRVVKRNNYTVSYLDIHGNISHGQVAYFFQNVPTCERLCLNNCNFHKPSYWAVILKLERLDETHSVVHFDTNDTDLPVNVCHSQISLVKHCLAEIVEVVKISRILDIVMYINFNGDANAYVCSAPNKIEKD